MQIHAALAIQYSIEPSIQQPPLRHAPAHCITFKTPNSNVSSAYIAATPAISIQYALLVTQPLTIEFLMLPHRYAIAYLAITTILLIEPVFLAYHNAIHARMQQPVPHAAQLS